MKRTLLTSALALTLAATTAIAQQTTQQPSSDATAQQPTGQYGHHRGHDKMDPYKAAQHVGKKLGLSDDQTAKLEPIFADSQQKMSALRANTGLTPDQRREQMKAIHKDTQSQLATVLTPDQLQQLHGMRRGRGKHQGGQQPEAATPPSAS
jgi:Spy/CpxP family protein refolding chaperone